MKNKKLVYLHGDCFFVGCMAWFKMRDESCLNDDEGSIRIPPLLVFSNVSESERPMCSRKLSIYQMQSFPLLDLYCSSLLAHQPLMKNCPSADIFHVQTGMWIRWFRNFTRMTTLHISDAGASFGSKTFNMTGV